jgi:hypothetical protein
MCYIIKSLIGPGFKLDFFKLKVKFINPFILNAEKCSNKTKMRKFLKIGRSYQISQAA